MQNKLQAHFHSWKKHWEIIEIISTENVIESGILSSKILIALEKKVQQKVKKFFRRFFLILLIIPAFLQSSAQKKKAQVIMRYIIFAGDGECVVPQRLTVFPI